MVTLKGNLRKRLQASLNMWDTNSSSCGGWILPLLLPGHCFFFWYYGLGAVIVMLMRAFNSKIR